MLRLVAQHAGRWNCPRGDYPNLDAKLAALKEHCRAVGRDFATLTISEQVIICIGSSKP
jgi:alkanesulfonate monooxygenase SsuD/methylene tetrahydromethanopterin reductase-like flavin-dependent oxidoreductase (luciferase family)